jgi:FtsP/CotA-like multicopper oxidase with cupredoxin domain
LRRHRVAVERDDGEAVPGQRERDVLGDKPTAGVMKDTINMTRFSTVEIDFVADDPGPSLLHCHHQDHQDEGFMGLMTYL